MINTNYPMLDELLSNIDKTPESVVPALKKVYQLYPFVREYIELTVSENWSELDINKIVTVNYEYHRSLAGALLLNRRTWSIVSGVLMNESASLVIKAKQYKALMEMLYSLEAEAFKHILLKTLPDLYPNLTHEALVQSLN